MHWQNKMGLESLILNTAKEAKKRADWDAKVVRFTCTNQLLSDILQIFMTRAATFQAPLDV